MKLAAKSAALQHIMALMQKLEGDKLRGPAKLELEMHSASPDSKDAMTAGSADPADDSDDKGETQPTPVLGEGHAPQMAAAGADSEHGSDDPALMQKLQELYAKLS